MARRLEAHLALVATLEAGEQGRVAGWGLGELALGGLHGRVRTIAEGRFRHVTL